MCEDWLQLDIQHTALSTWNRSHCDRVKKRVRSSNQTPSYLLTHSIFILLQLIFFPHHGWLECWPSVYQRSISLEKMMLSQREKENSFLFHPEECGIHSGSWGPAKEGTPRQCTLFLALMVPSGDGFLCSQSWFLVFVVIIVAVVSSLFLSSRKVLWKMLS